MIRVIRAFFSYYGCKWVSLWVKHISNGMGLTTALYLYSLQPMLINQRCNEYEWIRRAHSLISIRWTHLYSTFHECLWVVKNDSLLISAYYVMELTSLEVLEYSACTFETMVLLSWCFSWCLSILYTSISWYYLLNWIFLIRL